MLNKKLIPIFFYKTESEKEPVKEWLMDFPEDERKSISEDIKAVQIKWPIGLPLVSPIGNGLWEIRSKLKNKITRIIFGFKNNQIILLHGFVKKTQKLPKNEFEIAKKRAKDIGIRIK